MGKETNMKRTLFAVAVAAASIVALAGTTPNRLGDSAARRKAHAAQSAKALDDKRDRKAVAEAAKTNPGKTLGIKDFCGRKFGEKGDGRDVVVEQADRPYFGGYTKLRLKYSPSAGLYSITAINDDSFAIGDKDSELERIMRIVENHFKIRFSGGIVRRNNREYGQEFGVSAVGNSVTGGISGYRPSSRSVVTKPATRWTSVVSEEFKDVRISIRAVTDREKDKTFVEFTVELKPPSAASKAK